MIFWLWHLLISPICAACKSSLKLSSKVRGLVRYVLYKDKLYCVYALPFLYIKTQLLKIFLNVRHQISLQSKPHKEHEQMLYVPALSVNFMLQPHKQIRTNILLSSHNLKLKFMLYKDNHRAGRWQQSAIRLGHVSQIQANLQVILAKSACYQRYICISVYACVCTLYVCLRCIWGMCGFCLTSSISCSLWQSAGECANCFNWLTTRSRAMESFNRPPLYLYVTLHVCLICSVSVQTNNINCGQHSLVLPETGTWSPCNALVPVANPRLKDKLYQSRVTSAVVAVKSLGYDARKCAQLTHKPRAD